MATDTAFELSFSNIRFGPGVTRETGMDLADRGARRVMVVTDQGLRELPPVHTALQSLEEEGVSYALYDRARIEPTDQSFKDAIGFAQADDFDAFLAIGGGSVIDTAKAANLYATYPAEDFLEYVNAPIGKGTPVPGPLKPLIAVPTTSGTGSETTGVAVFDFVEMQAKTGIGHRYLKPALGLIDPENTRTMPGAVAAATGLDVLCHAIESYTAIPYDRRPKPERPKLRPAYQGCNPISDIWSLESVRMGARYIERAVSDPDDIEARGQMLLAASYAGLGFGNAGVHLPHAMSYPVSGMVRDFIPPGYSIDEPMIPHGMSVILNAPAVFRYIAKACPVRHLKAAEALGADVSRASLADAGSILADQIIALMQRLGMPNGLSAVGYSREDIPALVRGTLPQQRLTKLSPLPVGETELEDIFEDALTYW